MFRAESRIVAEMSFVVQICGYPGSGKTTLAAELEQLFGRRLHVVDVDLWMMPESAGRGRGVEMRAFLLAEMQRFVAKKVAPTVFVGTFGFSPKWQAVLPGATHFWLDVPLCTAIDRAMDRQIEAMRNGAWKNLLCSDFESADQFLSEYLNPFARAREWEGYKEALAFPSASKDEIVRWVSTAMSVE